MDRIIVHLDMDAFFASVEEAVNPQFSGKPIAVGSEVINGIGRGVVSTANYKAREYGIKSAIPVSIAWKLSEKAKQQGKEGVIFLPVNFELYNRVSQNIHLIIKSYVNKVEQSGIDEFYFDVSFLKTFKKSEAVCKKIKQEIKEKESITCSIGIAPNKLISKIAAGIRKPDGLSLVRDKDVQSFLDPLDIRELPGIGPKTADFFYNKNIKTIKDLRKLSENTLEEMLGKNGKSIYLKSRGIDNEPIIEFREVKSIGEQITFSENTADVQYIIESFKKLQDNVFKRFKDSEFDKFKGIAITIRFSDFETKSSSKSFKQGIGKSSRKVFDLEILKLILPFLDKRSNPKKKLIRLVGVRVEKLT